MSTRIVILILSCLSSWIAGCELPDDLIRNPEVDVWCGDTPCGWEVDGRIERVGSWHSHDYAVSFASDDARLHQLNPDADDSIGCMSFSLIAKVEAGAKAYVELDFLDDGEIDWSRPIPTANFESFLFYVTPPTWFSGVRFIVRKEGPGQVVIAKLRALDDVRDYRRCTADPVELDERPAFAPCARDDQCTSGICIGGACAGCASAHDCADGSVCGYAPAGGIDELELSLNVVPACISPGERRDGSLCLGDRECESGVCCDGVCSECCGAGSCRDELECAPSVADVARDDYALPHQCAPGMGLAERGAFCTADEDCASGACADRVCSGLCSLYYALLEAPDCAKRACDKPRCGEVACEVETVDVGRCD